MLKKVIGITMTLIVIALAASVEHILDLGFNGFINFIIFAAISFAIFVCGWVAINQFDSKQVDN